jgi:hypothetical protein
MEFVVGIIKYATIAIISFSLLSIVKPNNFTALKKLLIGLWFISTISIILFITNLYLVEPNTTLVAIVISALLLMGITKERFETLLPILIISYAVSYLLIGISAIISGVVSHSLNLGTANENGLFHSAIFFFISISIITILLKVRVKFDFLLKKGVGGIFIFISGIVFVFIFLSMEDLSFQAHSILFVGVIITTYGAYNWWNREKSIAQFEDKYEEFENRHDEILAQKDRDYKILKETHDYLALKDHKDNKTLDALQETIEKIAMRTQQADIIKEAATILKEIDHLNDRLDGIKTKKVYKGIAIPKTGLLLIDTKFEMISSSARAKGIELNLEINGNISEKYLAHIISQVDLINIIGDFAENAFVAINHLPATEKYRKIHFVLKNDEGILELSVKDSGIPFEIETLLSLGIELTTTHADDGGSGRGYETIFEMMDEYGASLTITEFEQAPGTYSKEVALCFDGKEEYVIKSPRAKEIMKQNRRRRGMRIEG